MSRRIVSLALVVAGALLWFWIGGDSRGGAPDGSARSATDGSDPVEVAAEVAAIRAPRAAADARFPVEVRASSSDRDADLVCLGRVELLDGSPLSDADLLILDASGGAAAGSMSPDPAEVLLRVRTDDDGELWSIASEVARVDRPFRLRHLGPVAVPQDDRAYPVAAVGSLLHRLPAGRILIRVADGDGDPVARAAVRIALASGGSIECFTGPDGSVVQFVSRPSGFAVHCYVRERRIGATIEGLHAALFRPAIVNMTLRPMDSGAVRVRVTDAAGRPVERFALRFLDHGRLVRYVTEQELWSGGQVVGLPEIPLDVRVDERFAGGPVLYHVTRKDTRSVTPDAAATAALHFEVDLQARIAFDVAVWGEDDLPLRVQTCSEPEDGEAEWRDLGVWQFRDDGATASVAIDGEGRWFSDMLTPGTVRIRVSCGAGSDPLLDQWIELAPGETAIRALERPLRRDR